MKFHLIDRITELAPGRRIGTVKSLSLAEEYLADHFPTFPVMPGVLMLECMVQSAAWLVRASEDFAHSLYVLAEARNVTYKSFVAPGRTLTMEVEVKRLEPELSDFQGRGFCDGQEVVKARISLRHINLADRQPAMASVDRELIAAARGSSLPYWVAMLRRIWRPHHQLLVEEDQTKWLKAVTKYLHRYRAPWSMPWASMKKK